MRGIGWMVAAAVLAATAWLPARAADEFNLGGAAKGLPSIVQYRFAGGDYYVAVFVRGPGDLMYAQVGDLDGGSWTGWAPIGKEALKGSPSCVARTADQIDCFGIGKGNAVFHIRYDAAANAWSSWESLGGFATSDPSAVRTIEGGKPTLRVYVAGPGGHLFTSTQKGGAWTSWEDLAVVVGGSPGCADTLKIGVHCYDTSGGTAVQLSDVTLLNGPAIQTDDLGGIVSGRAAPVTTGKNGDTLRVFVKGPGNHLWFKKWHGSWDDWVQLPVALGSPPACAIRSSGGDAWCATVNGDGSVSAFRIDAGDI